MYTLVFAYYSRAVSSYVTFVFFLMIRRPPRSTLDRSSAASDVYKRQVDVPFLAGGHVVVGVVLEERHEADAGAVVVVHELSLIHISEPTRPY